MSVTLRFLGTGAAEPVPTPGCTCANCAHARTDISARRAQSGILLTHDDRQYVVDCGPAAVVLPQWSDEATLGGVFISHLHPDHALGLYSLRWTKQDQAVPTFLPPDAGGPTGTGLGHEMVEIENWLNLEPTNLEFFSDLTIGDLRVRTLQLQHGNTPTQGFLFELDGVKIAYLIDGKGLPDRSRAVLAECGQLDCAIVDATYRPGTVDTRHNTVDEAVELGRQIGARLVLLTHVGHHNLAKPELEALVASLAERYDGQRFMCAHDGLTLKL